MKNSTEIKTIRLVKRLADRRMGIWREIAKIKIARSKNDLAAICDAKHDLDQAIFAYTQIKQFLSNCLDYEIFLEILAQADSVDPVEETLSWLGITSEDVSEFFVES